MVSIEQPLKFGRVVVKLFDFIQLDVNQDDSTPLLFLKASGLICFVLTSLNYVYMLICPNTGTAEFLQSNPDFIDSEEQEQKVECNKDTGGRKTLHCWSGGIFFIVSAGGHIEYWQPLYRCDAEIIILRFFFPVSVVMKHSFMYSKRCITVTLLN